MHFLLLILPFSYFLIMSIKEYGFHQTVAGFKGWGILRLIAFAILVVFVYKYIIHGESWFCGSCIGKGAYLPLILPSAGAGLIMFPAVMANSHDYSNVSKAKEMTFTSIGFILMVIGFLFLK